MEVAFIEGFTRYRCSNSNQSVLIKVPITPKHVFHLVQSLYGIRKNAAKILAFG